MLTIRRLYLYLVSLISLTAVTWAVILLARLVAREQIGQGQILELASMLATIIVGLPIFLFHWLMAQRLAAKDPEEHGSFIRRLYFWAMLAIGVTPALSNIYRLLDNGLLALVNGVRQNYYPYNMTIPEHLAAIIAWGVVLFYLWRQLQADIRLTPRNEDHLGIRRFYLLAFAAAGLVMISLGATGLLTALLSSLAMGVNWRAPVATGSAQLLVGAALWAGHWWWAQRYMLGGDPSEERSVLRKVYLYLAVLAFSVMAVVSASILLKRLIELLLGAPLGDEPLLSQLSGPLPWMLVGGVGWVYHWRVLGSDAQRAPEAPRQAAVRRIYSYLVAAVGLGVLLGGLTGLLTIIIDLATTPEAVGFTYYREQVSIFMAMLLVGAPVWILPWRNLQNLALAAPGEAVKAAAAADERRSVTRKIYLYFYVFVAALAIFGSVGWFVYHLLTALLGAPLPDDFITQVLNALVISLLAVAVWVGHWQAIRRDGQFEQANRAAQLADITVAVLDGEEGQLGQALLDHLRRDLPGVQFKPVGLTPAAVEAMAGQPLAADTLAGADYIVGAWSSLTSPQAAAAVEASPALKLAIPTGGPAWKWAGVKPRPADYYAQQAARAVKQAIAGEEINPGGEGGPIGLVLTILGGLFLLQIVFGIVMMGVSMVM